MGQSTSSTTILQNDGSNFTIVAGSEWGQLKTVIKGESGEGYDDDWVENDYIRLVREQGGVFINDSFLPLWNVEKGAIFLDGGYGSSKTTFVITRLLIKAMENKYFRCYYGRQKKTEARNLHSNIITEIKRNGWQDKFQYSETPTGSPEILCRANNNKFILFGCDDVDSLKGWDNPTDVLLDECNQVEWAAFGMIITRLRGSGYPTIFYGCFNNCDVLPDHWLRKYIYGDENPDSKSEKLLLDAIRKVNLIKHHSTYLDNYFQNPANYYYKLVVKANGDEELIKAYCEGAWGVNMSVQPYYKHFRTSEHVQECCYDPDIDLYFSFDENVNPYMPCLILQVFGNNICCIDEIAAESPNNTYRWVCEQLIDRYRGHRAKVFIFGDATSKKEDVKLEKGQNLYTLICDYLAIFRPILRVPDINPNNKVRGEFINTVFKLRFAGLSIMVDPRCSHMIEDFKNCPEDPDGKGKQKLREKVNGTKGVQRWGHFGDCFDYFICEQFMWAYLQFQNGVVSHPPTSGGRVVNNSLSHAEKAINYEQKEENNKKTTGLF